MKLSTVLAATLSLSGLSLAATVEAAEVRQVMEVKAAPAAVWAKIGAWCAIKDWHPAIANCEASKKGGDSIRTLTLKDGGGKITEKLTKTAKNSYSYAITDGPLPVKNYTATLTAKPDSLGTTDLVWTAKFEPAKGKTDAEASTVINGIFEAGLKSIKDMKFDAAAPAKVAAAAGAATAAAGAAVAAAPAAADPKAAADAKVDAKAKARADRKARLEAAKVAAMEKYAKAKAVIAEKAKAAADAAKAAYEKAKDAMVKATTPAPAAPKKP
jgi:Polyketide cyclase / dehydrase and lipid transport